ncbi:hypothetical protein CL689_03845 [Candidatus Saccharibacteria bacterium]|nr:hypothetical protein [Candidatus Saccharibacteria bacterium]|tara:strand:- start:2044 stop:3585 length:1542 start_codon:yes stop_codon:yes gene_type:complete
MPKNAKKTSYVNVDDIVTLSNSKVWLVSEFCKALLKMPVKEMEIIVLRCGLGGGTQRTLIEVGDLFDVTRERIRIIEKNCFSKYLNELCEKVTKKVDSAAKKSKTLLRIDSPEIEAEFPEVLTYRELFDYVIEKSNSPRKVSNQRGLITQLREAEVDTARTSALKEVKKAMKAGKDLTRKEVENLCQSCLEKTIPEIADRAKNIEYITSVATEAFKFNDSGKLLGTASSELSYVLDVLEKSTTALKVKDITRLANEQSGSKATTTYIRNICIEHPLIINLGPSIFGLEKHVGSITQDKKVIEDAMYKMAKKSPLPYLHHETAYNQLLKDGVITEKDVPSYKDLSVITQTSEKLVYMGYHRFTTKEKGAKAGDAPERSISNDIETFLEEAGGPLTSEEIVSRLKKTRVLRSTFQVSTWGRVAPMAGKWGLIGRDLPFDDEAVTKFNEHISKAFDAGKAVPYEDAKKKFLSLFKWDYDFNPHGAYLAALPRIRKIPCRFAQGEIKKGYVNRREKP